MTSEFELADKEFLTTRTKYRVEAIAKARANLKRLEREIDNVKAELEKAKHGDFTQLVEKYISPKLSEEFE